MPCLPNGCLTVTPSDTNTYAAPVTIFVGVGGNVTCSPASGDADVVAIMPTGGTIPFRVMAVKATGTTATNLLAIY